MELLAAYFRFLQLYAHACHNLVSGDLFLQFHDFFGDLYPKYEKDYDDLIERLIGLKGTVNILAITKASYETLSDYPVDSKDIPSMLKCILNHEQAICEIIAQITPELSIGSQQLIGEMANQSEMRQYKLKQFLKG